MLGDGWPNSTLHDLTLSGHHYNDARPHSQLAWKTPSEFAFACHPRRDLALRYAEGSAPAPVATTAQPGKSNSRGELRTG